MTPRTLRLTPDNLAVLHAAGHPIYLVRTPDAALWDYHKPITVAEMPGLRFKRHLLMFQTRGHREALELEVTQGTPPTRTQLLGKTLIQA
jgi:hypothetical protein